MRALLLAVGLVALTGAPAGAAPRPGFGWPLAGTVVVERGFDPPRTAYGPGHRGVDLRASVGQPVRAAGAGRVSYAGLLAGRGVVTVTHAGGLRTTYEPVAAEVRVGASLARGAILGRLTEGHASCRRASCLHWGLLRGRVYLNPLSLVQPAEVRLLPLGDRAGRPLTGALRVRPLAPAPPTSERAAAPEGRASERLRAAGAIALGGVLLGWTAWRRQDARGQARGAWDSDP
jgi:murein DD-endopeptidase MepM/ murein hydrolase activator NlpD